MQINIILKYAICKKKKKEKNRIIKKFISPKDIRYVR